MPTGMHFSCGLFSPDISIFSRTAVRDRECILSRTAFCVPAGLTFLLILYIDTTQKGGETKCNLSSGSF